MVKGLYASASGMVAEITRQEVIANNLAHASSSGFQRQLASFRATAPVGGTSPAGPLPLEPGVREASVTTDYSPGTVISTGNPLDVALDGDGFFVIRAPGGLLYTRDGGFRVGPEGRLETQDGDPVLGREGEIIVGRGPVTIAADGTVYSNGVPTGRLQVVEFPEGAGGEIRVVEAPRVLSGYREGSNVNTVREMAAMIAGYRHYEANQRAIQMQDRTLEQAAGEVARV
ncbi:MAG TPA: flagellar hook-basal body protein [Armatimonadota bacterium]|nr:flagellar hook-basal body protein [Armatimonadota bacterium]